MKTIVSIVIIVITVLMFISMIVPIVLVFIPIILPIILVYNFKLHRQLSKLQVGNIIYLNNPDPTSVINFIVLSKISNSFELYNNGFYEFKNIDDLILFIIKNSIFLPSIKIKKSTWIEIYDILIKSCDIESGNDFRIIKRFNIYARCIQRAWRNYKFQKKTKAAVIIQNQWLKYIYRPDGYYYIKCKNSFNN